MNIPPSNLPHPTPKTPLLTTDLSTDLSSQQSHAYYNPFTYRISISWFGGIHIYPKFR